MCKAWNYMVIPSKFKDVLDVIIVFFISFILININFNSHDKSWNDFICIYGRGFEIMSI